MLIKKKQMRRRIDTLITKNNKTSYDDYVRLIKSDKEKFEQFINFLTINVSEFYRNPEQWTVLEKRTVPGTDPEVWKEIEDLECCLFHRR